MTEFYLLAHPPARTQFYPSRVNGPSGAVGYHSTEGILDRVAPYTGNEAVAGFISRRTDPGSYCSVHELDGRLPLVPWGYTTFSIATSGFNSRTMSIAASMRASEVDPDDPATQFILRSMADETFDYWRWLGYNADAINAAAHWARDPAEPKARACLFTHGDVQGDRSDMFTRSAKRAACERLVLDRIHDRLGAGPAPAPTRKDRSMEPLFNTDGRAELLDLNPDGVVMSRWQGADGRLGGWTPITATQPIPFTSLGAYASPQDGRLIAVAGGAFGLTYYSWQSEPSSGPWVDWIEAGNWYNFLADLAEKAGK